MKTLKPNTKIQKLDKAQLNKIKGGVTSPRDVASGQATGK